MYQQSPRWLKAGVFDAMVQDRRAVSRVAQGNKAEPSAASFARHTLQATPASGSRAGYDGAKRRRGSKVHTAVDTLGHLLAAHVTAASEQDRSQVRALAEKMQEVTSDAVEVAFVDQGYTGEQAAQDAQGQHMRLEVVKLPEVKKCVVLLPRRWVVKRSHAWAARFRRLVRDYERLAETLAGASLYWSIKRCGKIDVVPTFSDTGTGIGVKVAI